MEPESSKREHPRKTLRITIRYFQWNEPHDAIALEIGGGGIFVESNAPLPEGSMLTLRVVLPPGRSFTVLGRVVRTVQGSWARARHPGMGIQFVDLSAEDRRALLDYINSTALLSA
jgi:type IV pilus assembly protein PilZ